MPQATQLAAEMLEDRLPGWRRTHEYTVDGIGITVHWEHPYFIRDPFSDHGSHAYTGTCLTLTDWQGSDLRFHLDDEPDVGHHVEKILIGGSGWMVCRINGLADDELPEAIESLLHTARTHHAIETEARS